MLSVILIPQSAVLGMHNIVQAVVVDALNQTIDVLALSYDQLLTVKKQSHF